MGSFIDDDDEFGPEKSRTARWQFAVRALDKFVPHWFQKEGRRVVGGMGQAAARAIESLVARSCELARERDEAMQQLAERPVTYKVQPRKHYSYNAQLAGADENAPYRWVTVVRFLDAFIPGWAARNNREENHTLGAAARVALEKLVEERDDARRQLEKLRNLEEKRQLDKVGVMGAMYGSNAGDLYARAAEYMLHPVKLKPDNSYPEWKDSYTKLVVDRLHSVQWKVAHGGLETSIVDAAVRAATDLLRDYHATQHEVYQQRDEARKAAKEMNDRLVDLESRLEQSAKNEKAAQKKAFDAIAERDRARDQWYSALGQRDHLQNRIDRAVHEMTINRIALIAPIARDRFGN